MPADAARGERMSYEYSVAHEGRERRMLATYAPDKDAAGRVKGFFVLSSDVTELARELGMAVLLDHSELDASCLTGRDIEEIAAFLVELDDRVGPCVCAIVARDAYTDGLAEDQRHYAGERADRRGVVAVTDK